MSKSEFQEPEDRLTDSVGRPIHDHQSRIVRKSPLRAKVTPQQSGGISTSVVLGGALIGILFVLIAAFAATADDLEEFKGPLPTVIPAPVLADGTALTQDLTFYATEPVALSIIAAPDNESENTIEACALVELIESPNDGNYFYLDTSTDEDAYWVYVVSTDGEGLNGWVPLDTLSETEPTACTEDESGDSEDNNSLGDETSESDSEGSAETDESDEESNGGTENSQDEEDEQSE